jgi:hypothetical protein
VGLSDRQRGRDHPTARERRRPARDCLHRPAGSTAHEADLDIGANSVYVHTRAALGFHEGMTIAVGWDKGAVREPARWRRPG